eukprot:jgi/Tetstr1/432856/TSEL_022205.t1
MNEESRGRTVTNLARILSPEIGVQILPADVGVVIRRPPKPTAADPVAPGGIRLPTTTGSVFLRLARRETSVSVLHTQWTGEGTAFLDRQGRRCSTRLLGAPHLDDIERPVHQVWLRPPSFRGITEADIWLRLAEGLLPAYDQPQPSEATTDQPAATPADVLALAGVRAWVEYEANTYADDAVICPPTRTLLTLLEVREFFRCALTAIAICIGPLANLELPTVERLAEAIAATISQRINTPPELQHAQWPTDTMTAAGVELYHHHTEPTLLRVGDDNLCVISLGQEDEEFADTLRLEVALTSHVALLRAIRLRTIVIYLTESEFDPSALLIHPFSQTIREAGELGVNVGHNHIVRHAAIGRRKKARKTAPASLALRATGRPIYTLTMQLTAHHLIIIGGTRNTDRTDQWRKTVSTACGKIKAAPAPAPTERRPADTSPAPPPTCPVQLPLPATPTTQIATETDDEEELKLNYEENDGAMEAKVTRYAHIPPWACDQREYVQYKFQQSVLEGPEIYRDKLQLLGVEQLIQHPGTRYQHPALTKAVAGFVTYGDHAGWLEKQAKARAKWEAQQERRALEEDYLAKRNERLRMLVVPGGRERLAAKGNYSPSRDPMFNGQDKAPGIKYVMDLPEVPPPPRGVYDYDAWVTDFLGQFRKPGKRRRR